MAKLQHRWKAACKSWATPSRHASVLGKWPWRWPADDPGHMIIYNIMASPRKTGFDLMLIRIGPVKNSETGKTKPRVKPTIFQGKWNSENRTITWTESDLPAGLKRSDCGEGLLETKANI